MKDDKTKINREALKAERDYLFRRYELSPSALHLVLKIKRIDDQIANDIEKEANETAKPRKQK